MAKKSKTAMTAAEIEEILSRTPQGRKVIEGRKRFMAAMKPECRKAGHCICHNGGCAAEGFKAARGGAR